MGWTDERTALAEKLWKDGFSAAQVAKQLGGVSRNAVIGKIYRLGLQRSEGAVKASRDLAYHNNKRQAPSHPAKAAKPKIVVSGGRAIMVCAPAALPRVKVPEAGPLPGTEPRVWTTRAFGECAFPVSGEGTDTMSCCAPTGGETYCAGHAARMFVHKSATKATEANRLYAETKRRWAA